jgi:hypothetical protein
MSSHTSTIYVGCTLPTYILDFSVLFFGRNFLAHWQIVFSNLATNQCFSGFQIVKFRPFLGFILQDCA